ncbi:ATP-dependent DNA helicase [Vibrio gigantis]|uniref:ATP-dependent DNA helicase n=1 Tax=Vibrio gigantis TaxID=296199 RepID=UPI001BFE90D8|nr:AAA family ATPase [Vibrio gigantis]
MSLLTYFKNTTLTPSQEELVLELDLFLTSDCPSTFLLKGFAGTGKTFITQGITKYLEANERQFTLMAPTGKAAKVISNKTQIEAMTIHRVVYQYFDIDTELNSESDPIDITTLKSRLSKNQDAYNAVYIVDEASMLSDQFSQSDIGTFGSGYLLQDLLEYINLDDWPQRKIVFIGDNAQLPPVRCIGSPALNLDGLESFYGLNGTEIELTDIVRQKADSGIVKNAMEIRKALKSEELRPIQLSANTRDVHILEKEAFLEQYFVSCKHKLEGCKDSVIITYSNRQVRDYNRKIRDVIFKSHQALHIGEQVMCVENLESDCNNFISNGEIGWVTQINSEIESHCIDIPPRECDDFEPGLVILEFIEVTVRFLKDNNEPFEVKKKVLKNLLESSSGTLTRKERKALLLDFKQRYRITPELNALGFLEAKAKDEYYNCLKLRYGYAITCHKAQGSEWPHVFVDNNRANSQSEQALRWLYTAVTRATQTLYIKQ